LKINISKIKVMVSGKNCGDVEKTGKWACAVYVLTVTVQYKGCAGWVHKHCSEVKGFENRIEDAFVYVCERADDAEYINIQERMDLENGMCLDRVRYVI